jgi:uncharacterized protein (DUF302 family)
MSNQYGFGCTVPLSLDAARTATIAALKEEGFGVLTEIDVQATLQTKLGVDHRPYLILGACNPQLAYQGLQAEPELGLLLPCNVIIYDNGDESSTVSIVDPIQMLGVVHNPALKPIADEANTRLHRVLDQLAAHRAV